ncbi:protein containing Fumarate reductase/succinate dehydrogenase flavoprotein, partial [mine drainage metagenome]
KDYPERDDVNFLKHTVARFSKDGTRFEYTPVVITKWKPAPRVY